MSFYANSEQVYACMGTLFERVLHERPQVAQAILTLRLVIRLRCTSPAADFTVNGRQHPVQATCGPSPLRPDLDISLSADTLHAILMDQLSIKKALAGGQLRVKGPLWKTGALVELLQQGRAFYPLVLQEQHLISE